MRGSLDWLILGLFERRRFGQFYMHMGAEKTWYGVPRDVAVAFEDVVRVHGETNPIGKYYRCHGREGERIDACRCRRCTWITYKYSCYSLLPHFGHQYIPACICSMSFQRLITCVSGDVSSSIESISSLTDSVAHTIHLSHASATSSNSLHQKKK